MSQNFVNIHGDRVPIDAMKAQAALRPKKKAKALPDDKKLHMGFVVTGYPPGTEEALRAEHAASQAAKKKADPKRGHEPFDLDLALSRTAPKRARAKPYEVPEAAQQCAELMRRAGWLRVTVTELIR